MKKNNNNHVVIETVLLYCVESNVLYKPVSICVYMVFIIRYLFQLHFGLHLNTYKQRQSK